MVDRESWVVNLRIRDVPDAGHGGRPLRAKRSERETAAHRSGFPFPLLSGLLYPHFVIVSIGTDIIEVYRIRETIERTPRFLERVFTPLEREYCEAKGAAAAQSFAARFAAKEAFLKAIRTGWRGEITWQNIEVRVDSEGAPSLVITGEAKRILDELGAARVHVSLSHTNEHATAQVVLESGE
jgi:holo-[acyl-carrier protein] synthase